MRYILSILLGFIGVAAAQQGAIDTDADGFIDTVDVCIEIPATAGSENGCPYAPNIIHLVTPQNTITTTIVSDAYMLYTPYDISLGDQFSAVLLLDNTIPLERSNTIVIDQ